MGARLPPLIKVGLPLSIIKDYFVLSSWRHMQKIKSTTSSNFIYHILNFKNQTSLFFNSGFFIDLIELSIIVTHSMFYVVYNYINFNFQKIEDSMRKSSVRLYYLTLKT